MRLNKSTSQAIRILADCARADEQYVKVAEISERLGITPQNVFKMVHLLSRAGLVTALRGRHGGVRLMRPANAIRVGDVVRALETMESDPDPTADMATDRRTAAGVHKVLDDALEAFISILDQHTVADLADSTRQRSPRQGAAGSPRRKRDTSAHVTTTRALSRRV